MATKYVLERGVRAGRKARSTPFLRLGYPGPDSDRRRMIVLFLAFSLFLLALLGFIRLQGSSAFLRETPRRGAGVIMEKMQEAPVPGGSTYWLRLSIAPEDGPALEARAEIDAALWQELKVGDRIMTVYTLDPQDKQIRVQETGRVALPPELR